MVITNMTGAAVALAEARLFTEGGATLNELEPAQIEIEEDTDTYARLVAEPAKVMEAYLGLTAYGKSIPRMRLGAG